MNQIILKRTFHDWQQSVAVSLYLFFMMVGIAIPMAANSFDLNVCSRNEEMKAVPKIVSIVPEKTAVVIVDMWDKHWCKTYTERVGAMVPRMNLTLDAARKLGIQVVHAPSDVLGPYQDTVQRKAMLAIPKHELPSPLDFNPPPPPWTRTGGCECGPDRPCQSGSVWSSENKDIHIADADLIGDCNNGQELYNLCRERGIDTLIYMGVASNMCVCHRGFGMLNMHRYGMKTFFVSDLVQAISGNGYDPDREVEDPNFTPAEGTAAVQRHLERFVSPSFESRDLLAIAGMGPRAGKTKPFVVFVLAEQEYNTENTLPEFARTYLERDFDCAFVKANPNDRNDVPGLDVMYDADLLVLSMRRRALPVTQMDYLEHYIRSGKPIVGLRVSIVPFQVDPKDRPDGHVLWKDFDREVLGCNYHGYDSESRDTGCEVWWKEDAERSPLKTGIDLDRFHSSCWIYHLNPLEAGTTLLVEGRWADDRPIEPVTFTNTYRGGRVFFTSLGHEDDFNLDVFTNLMTNAIYWALGMEVPQ